MRRSALPPARPLPIIRPVPTFRQRLVRWSVIRFLRIARRRLAREPSPGRVRRDMARFDRRVRPSIPYRVSPPVSLGSCQGYWVDAGAGDDGPVILYLHGGAFVGAAPNAHQLMLAKLCRETAAGGFYVDYRLAPEHRYPAASDDCLEAYRFLLGQGIAPRRIVIAGDSAGGNLTIGTAMRLRDQAMPQPAALIALSPVLDATFSGESVQRNDGLDPLFRASIIGPLADCYVEEARRREPYVSPLFGDLRGLPPSLVLVGSSEILLDDSVRFACAAGNATLQVWHGMPHVFPVMHGLAEAEQAIAVMARFIGEHGVTVPAANTSVPASARC